jgi:hypothetical protein
MAENRHLDCSRKFPKMTDLLDINRRVSDPPCDGFAALRPIKNAYANETQPHKQLGGKARRMVF